MRKRVYYFRPCPLASVLHQLPDSYEVIPIDPAGDERLHWQLPAVIIADAGRDGLERIERIGPEEDHWRVIYLLKGRTTPWFGSSNRVFALLPDPAPRAVIEKTVERAFESLRLLEKQKQVRRELSRVETLNKIGIQLSTEHNTDALFEVVLSKSREMTGCDAGWLYVIEEKRDGTQGLVFKLAQSDTRQFRVAPHSLPVDTESMAGYAAWKGETLNIPDAYRIYNLPFRLNQDLDREFNYRTKSMLVVPMKNQKEEVIGVLQLVNAKKHTEARLVSEAVVEDEVIPFSTRSEELTRSLASQAAVALENNLLYHDIQEQFEGFVKASIKAIELRDPTTSGHSERVAKLTLGLAEAVDRAATGRYAAIHFSAKDMQELRYASLLHDFGKVDVQEDVLVKAKKLYPHKPSLELIRERFRSVRKAVETASLEKKLTYALGYVSRDCREEFARIDAERDRDFRMLEEFLETIVAANDPSILTQEVSSQLAEIAGTTIRDGSGPAQPLLAAEEFHLLSIPRGTLDRDEREEIEAHVAHSFKFLSEIPWTKELKRIPEIAKAHHEKLDGSGYPEHIKGDQIPCQAKMMTIADIFDALTASDRPYKSAVSTERALDIIGGEVRSNLLDPALFQLFREAEIYRMTSPR
jgi:HD-GYP domain-containing protein (c-di-GMP phosphodiesterase class II)